MVSPNGDQVQRRNFADFPGILTTVLEAARAYRQYGAPPGGFISDDLQLALPIPMWAEYGYVVNGTHNLTAGQATAQTAFAVPGDERGWLDGYSAVRTGGGDGLALGIQITYPAGYRDGAGVATLMRLTAGATDVWWPYTGGAHQSVARAIPEGPIFLEPGTLVQIVPNGTGVAATTFDFEIILRRMKLFRANAP